MTNKITLVKNNKKLIEKFNTLKESLSVVKNENEAISLINEFFNYSYKPVNKVNVKSNVKKIISTLVSVEKKEDGFYGWTLRLEPKVGFTATPVLICQI